MGSSMNRHTDEFEAQARIIVAIVLIVAVITLALFFVSKPTNEYLAVYIESNDVNNINIKDSITFSFAVENHFNSVKEVPYFVSLGDTNISAGSLSVGPASKAQREVTFPFDKNTFKQQRVTITFPDSNQELFFSAGLKVLTTFDNNIALVDASFSPKIISPDGNFDLNISWAALEKIDKNYMVFVHFFDANNRLLYQYDHFPFIDGNTLNTSSWPTDSIMSEHFSDSLPGNLHEGAYLAEVGLYIPGSPAVKTKDGESSYIFEEIQIIE